MNIRIISEQEIVNLRAHHLMCLPGYKGKGYDGAHKTSWDTISARLKEKPDTFIRIVDGQDDLCANCPNAKGKNGISCNMKFLEKLDNKVKELLNITTGTIMTWKEIMNKMFSIMNKDKHKEMCGNCEWRKFGLCNDTFDKKQAA